MMSGDQAALAFRRADGTRMIILVDPQPGMGLLVAEETLRMLDQKVGPEPAKK